MAQGARKVVLYWIPHGKDRAVEPVRKLRGKSAGGSGLRGQGDRHVRHPQWKRSRGGQQRTLRSAAADQQVERVVSLTRSRASSRRSARAAALTRLGFPGCGLLEGVRQGGHGQRCG